MISYHYLGYNPYKKVGTLVKTQGRLLGKKGPTTISKFVTTSPTLLPTTSTVEHYELATLVSSPSSSFYSASVLVTGVEGIVLPPATTCLCT